MKIGIVNAGNIGQNLAISWIRHGHDIMLSKDTAPEQLQKRVQTLSSDRGLTEAELGLFKYGSLADAANFGDVVVLSVYFPRLSHVLKELQSAGVTLSRKIVIDTMNPLNVDKNFNHYHDTEYMQRTSTTKEIQKAFPEAIVFKAFNTFSAALLDASKWTPGRVPPVILIGGNSASTDTTRKLIEDAGFRPQFAGYNLADSGLLERLGVLSHRLVENEYHGHMNIGFDIIQKNI
jgi:predicted dinucleotide-binding enzyme